MQGAAPVGVCEERRGGQRERLRLRAVCMYVNTIDAEEKMGISCLDGIG